MLRCLVELTRASRVQRSGNQEGLWWGVTLVLLYWFTFTSLKKRERDKNHQNQNQEEREIQKSSIFSLANQAQGLALPPFWADPRWSCSASPPPPQPRGPELTGCRGQDGPLSPPTRPTPRDGRDGASPRKAHQGTFVRYLNEEKLPSI